MSIPDFTLVEFRPLDSLFFGGNIGLDLGSSASSLEFPLPWTVSGAILSHLIRESGEPSRFLKVGSTLEMEEGGELTKLMFYGPFLIVKKGTSPDTPTERWYPAPYDLVYRPIKLFDKQIKGVYSAQLPPVIATMEEPPTWIDEGRLLAYARGEEVQPPSPQSKRETPIVAERRLGITLDDGTRTAARGLIYSSRHIRLDRASIGVLAAWKDGNGLSVSGVVRLGGEGRPSEVNSSIWVPEWLKEERIKGDSVVRIVLLSPAIYRGPNGTFARRPPDEALSKLPGRPEICRLRGRELVIGPPPEMISGWDYARRRAKRMYPAVPAGTVIYLRLREEADRWELTREFWHLSLYWERGLGSPMVALTGGDVCG